VSLVVPVESNSIIFSRTRQDQGQITLFAPPKPLPLRRPQGKAQATHSTYELVPMRPTPQFAVFAGAEANSRMGVVFMTRGLAIPGTVLKCEKLVINEA
jgi:hypothetical protein